MSPAHRQLVARARSFAQQCQSAPARRPLRPVSPSFRADMAALRRFAERLAISRSACRQPAEDWLLDHITFIETQAAAVRRHLAPATLARLPRIKGSKTPRVYALADDYLSALKGCYDPDTFIAYVTGFQEVAPLTQLECAVLPSALQATIIRRLADTMREVRTRHRVCERVGREIDRLGPSPSLDRQASRWIGRLARTGALSPLTVVHLVRHLAERDIAVDRVEAWIADRLDQSPADLTRMVATEYAFQVTLEGTVGELLTSLHAIEREPWREQFPRFSRVDRILLSDPRLGFGRLDWESRDLLRRRVTDLADHFQMAETRVAKAAAALARHVVREAGDGASAPQSEIAYYFLDGDGVETLRQALGRPRRPRIWPASGRALPFGVYLGGLVATFFAVLTLFALAVADGVPLGPWADLALLAGLAFPASQWAVSLIQLLAGRLTPPAILIRYDYSGGIPERARTMVVMPVIWDNPAEVDDVMDRLLVHFLANRDRHIHFAVLADFTDGPQATMPDDAAVLARAKDRVAALRARYGQDRFFLFHRARRYNAADGLYMGWERKRGKLIEFAEFLAGKTDTSFTVADGATDLLTSVRYVMTVDHDTRLPIGTVQRLVATLDHPLHRPRLNAEKTRVVRGYGILQPRVAVSYEAARRSRFTLWMASEPGIDPYAVAAADPYQALFGETTFLGKGLVDIQVFQQVLARRIPDNVVLSHDLLEGGFLCTGFAADIEVVEDHPSTFFSFQTRAERWIRGDWQLGRWLRRRCPNRDGVLQRVDLSRLTRFQIVDNMRRSCLLPALYLVALGGATVLPGRTAGWEAIVALTLAWPLIGALLAGPRTRRGFARLLGAAGQSLFQIATLPYSAVLSAAAMGRALYRLHVSHRNLLEWVPGRLGERRRRAGVVLYPWPSLGAIALFFAFAGFGRGPRLVAWAWVALWLLAAPGIRWLNRPPRRPRRAWVRPAKPVLTAWAKETWGFFERFVNADDSWLPPDNVQLEPVARVAHRTSPSNIGLYLLGCLAAADLGLISPEAMADRLERTLATVETLPKWRGHLYNWYHTDTARPIRPCYVSTVDSGNLVTHLVTLQRGLRAWAHETPTLAERLTALADRAQALAEETDFRPLYDPKSRLFRIGFDAEADRPDPNLYDLLASEARQASFAAIAFGQVPPSHWFSLGRPMARVGGRLVLLAWSGTMFEYLMPALVMRAVPGGLWQSTYRAVAARQAAYASTRAVPLGISESGYFAVDEDLNYQYRAFGVPGLGLRPGLGRDLVVAPYAAFLALPFLGETAVRALARLADLGGRGPFGFYEAIDFTARRLPPHRDHEVVKSFMAHHQGMTLIALANAVSGDIMVERFHADPHVQAASLLLDERVPERPALVRIPAGVRAEAPDLEGRESDRGVRHVVGPLSATEVNVLANGSLSSATREDGGGFLAWQGHALTRWSEDPVLSDSGIACYLRDAASGLTWSPTPFPAGSPGPVETGFALHKSWYRGEFDGIAWRLEIAVDPEADAEVRRMTLLNQSPDRRRIEVTSYVELVLAAAASDRAHPAFSKLFIETERDPELECLVAHRRPREEGETEMWAAHTVYIEGASPSAHFELETDRAAFIGRGRDLSDPRALGRRLSGTLGAVTDPIFALRRTVDLDASERAVVYLVTTAGRSRAEALAPVQRLRLPSQANRAFHLAWIRSRVDLDRTGLAPDDAVAAENLAARLLYPAPPAPRRARAVWANRLGPPALWARGFSGTRPIVVIAVRNWGDLPGLVRLVRQCQYLRRLQVEADWVVLVATGEDPEPAADRVFAELARRGVAGDGITIVAASALAPGERRFLRATARVWLEAGGPSLRAQLTPIPAVLPSPPPRPRPLRTPTGDPSPPAPAPVGEFFNGWGGFTEDGTTYTILLIPGRPLPRPWSNVVANPAFGFLVTELGTGFTWWKNAHEYKLTPWSNDPVIDRSGEALFLTDRDDGRTWSATPWPAGRSRPFRVTHGFGWSRFEAADGDLTHRLDVHVPRHDPLKILHLVLQNRGQTPRRIAVTYYVEWVLGVDKRTDPFVITGCDPGRTLVTARNRWVDVAFQDRVAFIHLTAPGTLSWTGDRSEFIGRDRSLADPAGLSQPRLSCRTGVFASSCGAIQAHIEVGAGEAVEVVALLGCAGSEAEAATLVDAYGTPERVTATRDEVTRFWHDLTRRLEVHTPSRATDVMLNGWLLYQTVSARLWGRTGFYQAGGAFGFRDQLQDSLALLGVAPEFCRDQILRAASHQYEAGDVQHWWHPELGRGIRTRIADDPLWLAYAAARYVETTGDHTLWDVRVPFLESAELAAGERERYEAARLGATDTVRAHCLRAIERVARFGIHGLPLIGSGDWNDGMNRVGPEGRGESVWLGWFLVDVLNRYGALDDQTLAASTRARFRALSRRLAEALNRHAWDGQWFRRAFSDQGTWLGSAESPEGQIDAIAQSWAVISGGAPSERKRAAMAAFDRELVDRRHGLARLAEPYDRAEPRPGYVAAYPPGIRENGGQYTHAAVWSVIAWALLGEGARAFELFSMLNPISHASTPDAVAVYQNEPYVMSGDVSSAASVLGRGGWSWYTGSAGWMYQAGIEYLLGIRRRGDRLFLAPALPPEWDRFHFYYRLGRTVYAVSVELSAEPAGEVRWTLDGTPLATAYLPLCDDGGNHEAVARCSNASAVRPG